MVVSNISQQYHILFNGYSVRYVPQLFNKNKENEHANKDLVSFVGRYLFITHCAIFLYLLRLGISGYPKKITHAYLF